MFPLLLWEMVHLRGRDIRITRAYGRDMGKVTDGVRKVATKMGNTLRWPKRRVAPPEKKQLDRWEAEGGSVLDDDEKTG